MAKGADIIDDSKPLRSGEEHLMTAEPRMSPLILVVENEATAREGLDHWLQQEGYRVAVAADGQEALDRLRGSLQPDLILVDLAVPGLDGWQFLKVVQQNPVLAGTPVVILTAAPLNSEWAQAHGCAGLARKPIEFDGLRAEVRRCLGEA
jgi:CheY-like chemotaxis protein